MGKLVALFILVVVFAIVSLAQAVQPVDREKIMRAAFSRGVVVSLDVMSDPPVLRVGHPWYKEELTDRAGIVHAAAYEVMRMLEKAQRPYAGSLIVVDAASGRKLTFYQPDKPLIIDGQVTKPRWDKHFPPRLPPPPPSR